MCFLLCRSGGAGRGTGTRAKRGQRELSCLLCARRRGAELGKTAFFWFNNLPFPRNCKKFQSCGKIRLFPPFKHLQRDTRRHLGQPLASAVTRAMEGGSPRGEPLIHCCGTPSPPPHTPEAEKGDVNPLRGGSGGGWQSPTAPREGRGATPPALTFSHPTVAPAAICWLLGLLKMTF